MASRADQGEPGKLALGGYTGGRETSGVRFDWNAREAAANLFLDSLSAVRDFWRFILWRLLVVAHVQDDEVIRIVTARLATRAERRLYEEG